MRSTRITLLCWSVAVALFAAACAPAAPPAQAPAAAPAHDAAMDMHHLHGLMAHGFEMALEGADVLQTFWMVQIPWNQAVVGVPPCCSPDCSVCAAAS